MVDELEVQASMKTLLPCVALTEGLSATRHDRSAKPSKQAPSASRLQSQSWHLRLKPMLIRQQLGDKPGFVT